METTHNFQSINKVNGRDIFWGIISYLGVLVILPFGLRQRSEFLNHHLRQGLGLMVGEIILTIIFAVPFFGWILGMLGWVLAMVFSIIGIAKVVTKKTWTVPVFSIFGKRFKI